jgi:hypothetical protein
MKASLYDFAIDQGSSFRLSFIYKDAQGNPIDLTGWCARLIWKTNKGDVQTFITTNVDYTIYKFTIDPLLGKVTLLLPPSTTNNLAFNTAKYDLELQSDDEIYTGAGKNIIRLLYGNITLNPRFSKTDTLLNCD